MCAALLESNALTRRFGGLVAVNEVCISVKQGEVRGLIGPNGAGKSTLLALVSGLLSPTSGSIILDGADVSGLGAHRRASLGVGRTFQNLKVFEELSALENVKVGRHYHMKAGVFDALLQTPRHRREECTIRDAALEALCFVGLLDHAETRASSLPYGHRRKLEIARAIVGKPKLLLLDEPAAGLNSAEAISLVDTISQINRNGITVLLVDHHMELVMAACSKITVLNYGKKLAEGTPAEISTSQDVIEAYLGRPGVEQRIAAHA
jgi:branched-chain amino acid transport system ATP-binding protein